jgi:hypothetical protein
MPATIRSLRRVTMKICPEGAFANGVLKARDSSYYADGSSS